MHELFLIYWSHTYTVLHIQYRRSYSTLQAEAYACSFCVVSHVGSCIII